jgi:hypothetical protein
MLWLLLVAVLMFAALSIFAFPRHGNIGLVAAAVSVLVCLLPACAALLVTGLWAGTPNAINGIFLGVFLRTAVPLLLALLLTQAISPLADAGLFAMVLVNFLVMLTVETILVVRIVQTHTSTVYR